MRRNKEERRANEEYSNDKRYRKEKHRPFLRIRIGFFSIVFVVALLTAYRFSDDVSDFFASIGRLFGHKIEITTDLLKEEVIKIGELATLEYNYTRIDQIKNVSNLPGLLKIFDPDDELFYSFDGTIKFGINCEEIVITEKGNKIIIEIPPVEILSHEVDRDSMVFYKEDKAFATSDFWEYLRTGAEEQEERAINVGLPQQAFENAAEQIERLVSVINLQLEDKDKYEIECIEKKE